MEQGPDFWCWFDTTQFSYHCAHPIHAKMFSIQMLLHFSQIVQRVCTLVLFIDLVIMSAPQSLHECVTIPPLANSDHIGISLQVKSNIQTHIRVNKRVIWRYAHADFDRACELIDMLDMVDSNSVEKSWSNWKRTFMSIVEDCVPKAQLPNRRNLPWLTKEIVRTLKKGIITIYRIARKCGILIY